MAVFFLDVLDFFALLEEQVTNLQGGTATETLLLVDSADHNFVEVSAFNTLAFSEIVGLDYAVYQISVAETLNLVEVAQRGPAAAAAQTLTFGDTARVEDAADSRHTLLFVEVASAVPTRGLHNALSFTQLATVNVNRVLTATQTFALSSGCGGLNLNERCKQYRTLAGPNSAGGA